MAIVPKIQLQSGVNGWKSTTEGGSYNIGDTVTHSNNTIWVNITGSNTEPSDASQDWVFVGKTTAESAIDLEVVNMIVTGKLVQYAYRGLTNMPIQLQGSGANLNAPASSATYDGGANKRQQTSVIAVGESFGLYTNVRLAHMRGKFYYRSEAMYSGCANSQIFMGLIPSIAPIGNQDLDLQTDIVGIGKMGTDTKLHIFTNDNSGTATKIPLGPGTELEITDSNVNIRTEIFKREGEIDQIYLRCKLLPFTTGRTAYDTGWIRISDNLPTDTSTFAYHNMCNRRADASGTALVQLINDTLYV